MSEPQQLNQDSSGADAAGGHDRYSMTELVLLGRFELRVNGRRCELSPQCESLVAAVALKGAPVGRSQLAGRVWPETFQDRANANLRAAVWRLKGIGVPVLRCSRRQLEIDPSVRVDVEAVSRWADRLIGGTPESNDLEFALTPDMFTLLADSDGDWLVVERERFRQRILHAADRLIDLLCDAGSFARALDVGLAALAQEPMRESTNLAVMRVHLREGNRSEAVRHYERCCALLRSELSVEPSEALRCLAADAHAR